MPRRMILKFHDQKLDKMPNTNMAVSIRDEELKTSIVLLSFLRMKNFVTLVMKNIRFRYKQIDSISRF